MFLLKAWSEPGTTVADTSDLHVLLQQEVGAVLH